MRKFIGKISELFNKGKVKRYPTQHNALFGGLERAVLIIEERVDLKAVSQKDADFYKRMAVKCSNFASVMNKKVDQIERIVADRNTVVTMDVLETELLAEGTTEVVAEKVELLAVSLEAESAQVETQGIEEER